MADPTEEGKAISVVWEVPSDFPTHYATHLVVQHTEDDFTVTFWDLRPPVLIGTPEEKRQQVEAIKGVRATTVARIILSPRRMREFAQVMQDNLKTFDETVGAQAKDAKR